MWSTHDLIVAPATVGGAGARAIVRLAGDGLERLLAGLFAPQGHGFAASGGPARVVRAQLAADGLAGEWGRLAVEVIHWPGPGGPVGGPLAEVQLPASPPLVAALVAEACRHGARLARGGEFTLRGFLSGRLDLLQAEAVLSVVDARSPAELSAALDRLAGGAGAGLESLRSDLIDLLADVEAAIDFADEATPDAVPVADDAAWQACIARLAAARAAIDAATAGLAGRDVAAGDLPRAVLVGHANVGKSSLFNALVGRDAALVADEAGTTRDWIEARLERPAGDGPAALLVDLAGFGAAATELDLAAVAAARVEIGRAAVLVVCRDARDRSAPPELDSAGAAARIDVLTRIDLLARINPLPSADRSASGCDAAPVDGVIVTSSHDGTGIDRLRDAILATVAAVPPRSTPATLRMRAGLVAAATALAQAAAAGRDEALVAGGIRTAVEALGEITGAALGTDLLDRIFSRHCIGK